MTAGCVNGMLENVEEYIWTLFGVRPGQDARNFAAVFNRAGMPTSQQEPGDRPNYANGFHGITLMKGAIGDVRGVIHLPTNGPDGNGYYTRQILLLRRVSGADPDPEGLVYAWVDRGAMDGAAPYAPGPCDGSQPVPDPTPPPMPIPPDLSPVLHAIADLRQEQTTGITMLGQQIEAVGKSVEGLKFAGVGSMRIPILGTVHFAITLTRLP